MNIANHKKTILILILILIVFFGYWFLFLSKKDVQNTNTNTSIKTQNKVSNTKYDKDFVSSLLSLNSVDLNVSLFQTPAYKALSYPEKPFVVNYIRESGRFNPFLPIGIEGENINNVTNNQDIINNNAVSTTTLTTPPTTSSSTSVKPILKKF